MSRTLRCKWARAGCQAVFAVLLLSGFAFAADRQEKAKQEAVQSAQRAPAEGPAFPVPFDADRENRSQEPGRTPHDTAADIEPRGPKIDPIDPQPIVAPRTGAWLGVDLNDRFRRHAVVLNVHRNSPAERAGLRADDLILTVAGTEIMSPEHLAEVIGQMQPGSNVEIEVDRNRRRLVGDVILGQRDSVAQRREVGRLPLPPAPDDRDPPPVPPGYRDPSSAQPAFNNPPPPPPDERQSQPRRQRLGSGLLRWLLPGR